MYALLSPAKKLVNPSSREISTSEPVFWNQSRALVRILKGLEVEQIRSLMKLSSSLGELNHQRYQQLSLTDISGTAAALTFAGDTYVGLKVSDLDDASLRWSQNRVGILSGLYGLLRPLDRIEPYRLEMGTRLQNDKGKTLYDFWREHVAVEIQHRVKEHRDRRIVNLASAEYFNVVQTKDLSVVHPVFKDKKNGVYKVVSFYAKRARGSMAHQIIKNKIEDADRLKELNIDGYVYSPEQSDEQFWVFIR